MTLSRRFLALCVSACAALLILASCGKKEAAATAPATATSDEAAAAEVTAAAKPAHPVVGTTLDYLDYVFYDKLGAKEIYPLEVYEQRLREIAETGIKRVYLRVNCCGVTLYPTKVTRLYGDDFAWHWGCPVESARLTKTVRTYDVCAETIRLCHKYGMEAWAWESLGDGGSNSATLRPETAEEFNRSKGAPFSDPFFFEQHLECYARRDPRKSVSVMAEDVDTINAVARKFPVAKIVCTETEKRPPLRITAETLLIYTSDDNVKYALYDQPYEFVGGVNDEGLNTFTISGLNITANYIKLSERVPFSDEGNTYTFAMRGVPNQMQVYNTQGAKIHTEWHANISGISGENGTLDLRTCNSTGWDYKNREIGFVVGAEPPSPYADYHIGFPEYAVPLAREHQLARFAELAAYPFDGFMMNIRSHSWCQETADWGFNPEIREIYKQRYGTDIWTEDYDLGKIMEIRGEGIAIFYKGCKSLCGNRPFWVSTLPPAKLGERAVEPEYRGMGTRMYERIPWLYKKYFEDGSVDGIMMIGADFSSYFTPEVTGGKHIPLGIFRECSGHIVRDKYYYPADYDFQADMLKLYNNPNIEAMELYETLEFTNNAEKREILRKMIRGE